MAPKPPTTNAQYSLPGPPQQKKKNTKKPHQNPAGGHAAPTGYATIAFKYAGISNAGSLDASTAVGAASAASRCFHITMSHSIELSINNVSLVNSPYTRFCVKCTCKLRDVEEPPIGGNDDT